MTGRLHSIETMGSLDGPGLRTVFFLQGCNMQCVYCHNRDSWNLNGGHNISVEEVVSTALSYKEYYGDNGGVTFSGGEPLLQADFLIQAVKELKKFKIHTAIDTSGSIFNEKTIELFNKADLVLLDIKHSQKNVFEQLCSYPAYNAFACLEYLQSSNNKYWIRQVIVRGFTDEEAQIEGLVSLLYRGNKPEKIELLPYHDMGKEKWMACGTEYQLGGITPPSEERMTQLKNLISRLKIGGAGKAPH